MSLANQPVADSFLCLHPDYRKACIYVRELSSPPKIRVYRLSPLDLAISKLSRFQQVDIEDIEAILKKKKFSKTKFIKRYATARAYYTNPKATVFLYGYLSEKSTERISIQKRTCLNPREDRRYLLRTLMEEPRTSYLWASPVPRLPRSPLVFHSFPSKPVAGPIYRVKKTERNTKRIQNGRLGGCSRTRTYDLLHVRLTPTATTTNNYLGRTAEVRLHSSIFRAPRL